MTQAVQGTRVPSMNEVWRHNELNLRVLITNTSGKEVSHCIPELPSFIRTEDIREFASRFHRIH